jgi:hypothetical protein
MGARYKLDYVGAHREIPSAQGFLIGGVEPSEPLKDNGYRHPAEPGWWVGQPGFTLKRSSRFDSWAACAG